MPNTVIALKKSGTPSSVPASLANGELAINYADGKLFYKAANGTIAEISGSGGTLNYFGTVNANSSLLVADTPGDILSIAPGNYIEITGNTSTDSLTITANILPAFSQANAAYAKANAGSTGNTTNTQVLFNDANTINGSSALIFYKSNNTLAATNLIVQGATTIISANSITVGSTEINSVSLFISVASNQILDSFANTFRSAHYHVTMNTGTDYQTTQISLVHNDSDSFLTEYGKIQTSANDLGLFTTTYNSGSIRLNVTPTFANTTFKFFRTATAR